MEVSDYFDSDDMIKWEEKEKSNQTFAVVQTFLKNKYDSYVKHSRKNHEQFEGTNIIKQVTQWQEHLDAYLQDYLEQLASTNS